MYKPTRCNIHDAIYIVVIARHVERTKKSVPVSL